MSELVVERTKYTGPPALIGKAPSVIRNSSSATKDSVFVYWASPKGEIQPAADSRITEAQLQRWPEYRHWRRCEAHGPKEIEKVSIIISRQMWEKKKQMKIEQHMREIEDMRQLGYRCKLRLAQNYSRNDFEMNERILKRVKRAEENLFKLIASEFSPDNRSTYLEVEVREQNASKIAHVGQKRQGLV
jgi:hypothetical protein